MNREQASSPAAVVRQLQVRLDESSSRATKTWWERYLRGAIEFRGIGIPQIRSILADWRSEGGIGSWPLADQFELALRLFEEPLAEDKLAGILLLQEYLHDQVPWRESTRRYASLFERGLIADWSTCDWFCVRVLGPMIALRGRACAEAVAKWSRAPQLWKARASVVGFVTVIAQQDYHPLVLRSSRVLIQREERFAKTAVGWILRELSKQEPSLVTAFVEANIVDFSTESLRNALKYLPAGTLEKLSKARKSARRRRSVDGAALRR